jgi:hypothetical protein
MRIYVNTLHLVTHKIDKQWGRTTYNKILGHMIFVLISGSKITPTQRKINKIDQEFGKPEINLNIKNGMKINQYTFW